MASRTQRVEDDKGRVLDSLAAAHAHAVDLIGKAISYLAPEDLEGWTIQITDGAGRIALTVIFPAAQHRIWHEASRQQQNSFTGRKA